jgi:hypothetical protein
MLLVVAVVAVVAHLHMVAAVVEEPNLIRDWSLQSLQDKLYR